MTKTLLYWVAVMAVAAAVAFGRPVQSGHDLFQQALVKERAEGDLQEAIDLYDRIVRDFPEDHALAAKALVQMGQCYEKLGKAEAKKAYERVIRDYADQAQPLQMARARLAALSAPTPHDLTVRRIWADPTADLEGQISPDGRHLSFVDWRTGDLVVRDLAEGRNRRLTNKGSWEDSLEFALFSHWSPDGQRIAFDWWSPAHSNELRIVGVEGGRPRVLHKTPDQTVLLTLDWSPDGRDILVLLSSTEVVGSGPRKEELATVSVAEGDVQIIRSWENPYPYDTVGGWAGFSPDGRFILYSHPSAGRGSSRDVFVLTRDGREQTRIVDHPANDLAAGWSPDGGWVLFVSDRTGTLDLWALPVKDGRPTGEPQTLKAGVGRMVSLGFDRAGRYYYGTSPASRDIFVATLDPRTGRVLSPPSRPIKRYEGQNDWPSYSRDGERITYVSARGSLTGVRARFNVLCVRSLETGEEREFFTDFRRLADPRFSADGKDVFVVAWTETGQMGLYRFDAATGERSLLMEASEGQSFGSYAVSPDGKAIFYTSRGGAEKACRLLKRDLASGVEKEIFRGPYAEPFTAALSPDGRSLALLNRHPEDAGAERVVRVVPAAGGTAREVYRFAHPTNASIILEFSADGEYVFLPRKPTPLEGPTSNLFRLPVQGGEPEDLGLKMIGFRGLSAHPDGTQILFSSRGAEEKDTEVWVIEDFLPAAKAGD
jgi:Tol biopolymer transport system component